MKLALGEDITVVQCPDPSLKGLRAKFVSESMQTIRLKTRRESGGRRGRGGGGTSRIISVPKKGSAIHIESSGEVLLCDEMVGRLEERLARGSRY